MGNFQSDVSMLQVTVGDTTLMHIHDGFSELVTDATNLCRVFQILAYKGFSVSPSIHFILRLDATCCRS